jgi:hypothetical protein
LVIEEDFMKSGACLIMVLCVVFVGTFVPVRLSADDESGTTSFLETGFSIDGWLALHAVTAYIDAQIGSVEHVLLTAAASEEARSGTWERVEPLLKAAQDEGVPGILWFARTDGSYYVVDRGLVKANIADRPYFSKVMAGKVSVGDILVSRSTGKNATVVVVPIKSGGEVTGILGASLFLDALNARILKSLDLPETVIFYVLDSRGIAVLHYMPGYLFQDPTMLQNPSLTRAVKKMMSTRRGAVQYEFEGKPRMVIYATSSYTGWHVVLGRVSGR